MKIQIRFGKKYIFWLVSLGALLLAAGCIFPFFGPKASATPTSTAETSTEVTTAPITLTRVSGAPMLWMDGSNFVYVEGGEFVMGANLPQGSDFNPTHTVNLQGFWIHQAEVTNQMYAQCVEQDKCAAPLKEENTPYWYSDSQHANAPVVGVTWSSAMDYCTWIQGTLPTEAQWEKAARGTDAFMYPWGNTDPTCDLLNFQGCLNPPRENLVFSYPLGVSPYNAADLGGNILEWAGDWYAADYYLVSPANDPTGPETGTQRVARSSSFTSLADALQTTLRTPLLPTAHSSDLGFRCVLAGDVTSPAPPCTASSFIPETEATPPPLQAERSIELVSAYCQDDAGQVTFDIPGGEDHDIPMSYHFTTPSGELTCVQAPGSSQVTCYGPGLIPGAYATVTICPRQIAESFLEPTCPTGYTLDMDDGLCHYNSPSGSGEDCSLSELWVDGYGCLPVAGEGPVPCPPGFVELFISDGVSPNVCAPVGESGSPATCIIGSLAPALGCCQIPENVTPVCPTGWTYDLAGRYCSEDVPWDHCQTFTFFISACPTLPPPEAGCPPQTCSISAKEVWCPALCQCVVAGTCK